MEGKKVGVLGFKISIQMCKVAYNHWLSQWHWDQIIEEGDGVSWHHANLPLENMVQ